MIRIRQHYPRILQFVSIAAVAVALTHCNWGKSSAPQAPMPVDVIKLEKTNVPLTKEYIGITQSIDSIDIRARVKGFLTQMDFVEGSAVKKGQLLYVIDPRPFEAKLSLAQGQLSKSIANREFLQIEYMRQKVLVSKGDTPKSTYDESDAQYRAAVGDVESNTASVEEAKINLGYCSMYSPVDGIIGKKYVDVGNLVGGTEDTLLATVVTLNPIYIEFNPSLADYSQFLVYRENMPFKVEATLPQDTKDVFHGKIDLINNQADVATSTILMRSIMDNPSNLLLPGVYVDVKVTLTDKYPAILVPIKAVTEIQGQFSVFVLDKKNQVQSRLITVSTNQGSDYIVLTGVEAGDLLIISGLQKLQSGMQVTPVLQGKKG